MARRTSKRIRIIEQAIEEKFGGGPVLLEELRWHSALTEHRDKGLAFDLMTRSLRNSYARTIRDHIPALRIQKLPRPDALNVGIVTRAAVYRLASWNSILRFFNGKDATVFVKYQRQHKNRDNKSNVRCELYTQHPNIENRTVVYFHPSLKANEFEDSDLLGKLPYQHNSSGEIIREENHMIIPSWSRDNLVGRMIFPISVPLTLVTVASVTADDLKRIANVSWKIYRHSRDLPKILRQNEPVRTNWQGGYLGNPLTRGPWSKADR